MRSRFSDNRIVAETVWTLAAVFLVAAAPRPSSAAERRFLVTLADTTIKQLRPCSVDADCRAAGNGFVCDARFGDPALGLGGCVVRCTTDADCTQLNAGFVCGFYQDELNQRVCRPPLPSPELIRREYFDENQNNATTSFAEYFREISYGDVTITGQVTDWTLIPWRITRQPAASAADRRDVNGDGFVQWDEPVGITAGGSVLRVPSVYGESFNTTRRMVGRDINHPNDTYLTSGGAQVSSVGRSVFTPGERFLDLNNDGVWNGIDERFNQMDFFRRNADGTVTYNCPIPPQISTLSCPDNKPDLLGPWVDLNDNGTPDNVANCIYIPDSDNDGNPDCCPKGVSPLAQGGAVESSCRGLVGTPANLLNQVCPATTWEGPGGTITDCNGNLVDDAIDIFFGNSDDVIPGTASGDACVEGPGDGIPDECQARVGSSPCVVTVPDPCTTQDPPPACCACTPPDGGARIAQPRCEFHDINENGVMDDPEPFENFLPGRPNDEYIRFNFPGTNPDAVIARSAARRLSGAHDPLRKLSATADKRCRDGTAYTDATGANCTAGTHAEFDAPDEWTDTGSGKATIDTLGKSIPEPVWYETAWRDRYGDSTTPPDWISDGVQAAEFKIRPLNNADRPPFNPDRGGTNGSGFVPPANIPATARILPDEIRGVGQPWSYFDGPVEYDDVPSSKYHRLGDGRIGEPTSPFSSAVAGEDRGFDTPGSPNTAVDNIIPAAGPYATRIEGQRGHDGGNVLQFEWLTWRTTDCCNANCTSRGCTNSGDAWEAVNGHISHPFAGASGGNYGFRDYNLDRMIDRGWTRPLGSEFYNTVPTEQIPYPFTRDRLIEDLIEALDEGTDFDDFVDTNTLDRRLCPLHGPGAYRVPEPYSTGLDDYVEVFGLLSGVVLTPNSVPEFPAVSPDFIPVHNDDATGDPAFFTSAFPRAPGGTSVSWNIAFHDLVISLNQLNESGIAAADFQTALVAHEYLHAWEGFPDLYDYDEKDGGGTVNCPMGEWDIMSKGGLVHPIPALKEGACTDWVEPVDLTTVLTPGVTASITLPTAEFVRDNSYFFLENEDRPGRFVGNQYIPGERFYIWSAGNGFDSRMPGDGVLILHADANSSNADAIALQQRNGARPAYRIIQADGLDELRACIPQSATDRRIGDAGDPFPGTNNQRTFDCNTNPISEWFTDSACTGLSLEGVSLDGEGAAILTLNWAPTSIPSLRFVDPPGGVSVGNPPNAVYNVRAEANDVFGGTRIRFFYTNLDSSVPDPAATTSRAIVTTPGRCPAGPAPRTCLDGRVGISCTTDADCDDTVFRKNTPGFRDLSTNWNVSGLSDGRYYLFADLIPAAGADGTERKFTEPRAGRNNQGTATLEVLPADVLTSTLNAAGQVAVQGKARSETWTMRCINASTGEWVVNSSLTLPVPRPDAANQDPYPHAITGTKYVSAAGGVSFTIQPGPAGNANRLGVVGDTFTFTTTGITARSEGVTVRNGRISEDPVAVIDATPLSGLPPLLVSFDARRSTEPNGAPLTYRWTFGDGSTPVTGSQPQHEYRDAGTFTVTLRATNTANGRFGEASVDIRVINNSPSAEIRATPASGIAPLVVNFNAAQSSDAETPPDQLIYQWEFGDGTSANDARVRGLSFREVSHTYSRRADGTACTVASPCNFTATLTVTDDGGITDTDSTIIRIGNTNPVANVTFSPLVGPTPWTVTFNAKNSTDAEFDPIEVEWIWGDGTANEIFRAPVGKPPASDGSVAHTFTLPAGQATRSFTVRAILRDLTAAGTRKGGETTWPGVTVTVTTLVPDTNHPPTARFTVTPLEGIVGEPVSFDASASTDADGDDLRFQWDFGDGDSTQPGSTPTATHTYDQAGTFTARLTVHDEDDATATATQVIRILAEGANRNPTAIVATGPRTGPAPLNQTFDGRLSFDPDLESLSYTWRINSGDLLIDTLTGAVATRIFENEGTFTVTLTVQDVRGGSDTADPVTVIVAGEVDPPDDGTEPPRPGPTDPPDSANQRPTPFVCGLGMLGALFATWAGLGLTALLRRRGIR